MTSPVPDLPPTVPDDLEQRLYDLTERLSDPALPLLIEDRAFVPVHDLVRALMARHHPRREDSAIDLAVWSALVRLALRTWVLGPIENHEWRSRVEHAADDWNAYAEWCLGLPRTYARWAVATARLVGRATAPDAREPSARVRCLLGLWAELAGAEDVLPPDAGDDNGRDGR